MWVQMHLIQVGEQVVLPKGNRRKTRSTLWSRDTMLNFPYLCFSISQEPAHLKEKVPADSEVAKKMSTHLAEYQLVYQDVKVNI